MLFSEALHLAWVTTRSLFIYIFFLSLGTYLFVLHRLYSVLCIPYVSNSKSNLRGSTRSLAVFLGSGGHTTEAITLVSSLDFDKYSPRTYIISEGDSLSAKKAVALENLKKVARKLRIQDIDNAPREKSTPIFGIDSVDTILSKKRFADVLLINGPGTSVALVLVAYFNRFWWLESPRIIYVESFARVSSLSLSGKIVRPLADRFLVQWPNLVHADSLGTAQYRGWLV